MAKAKRVKPERMLELEKILRKGRQLADKEERERYAPKSTRKEVGECSCGGEIIRVTKTTHEYHGDPMHMIIGPGYRNQLTQVVKIETYCTSCKLFYSNSGTPQPKKKAARSS
jgi:hypothetical protein